MPTHLLHAHYQHGCSSADLSYGDVKNRLPDRDGLDQPDTDRRVASFPRSRLTWRQTSRSVETAPHTSPTRQCEGLPHTSPTRQGLPIQARRASEGPAHTNRQHPQGPLADSAGLYIGIGSSRFGSGWIGPVTGGIAAADDDALGVPAQVGAHRGGAITQSEPATTTGRMIGL
jgi:hypothetical protein